MKTESRRFRAKVLQSACCILITAAGLFVSMSAQADGCFVVPKFVWDKHKDINEPTQKAIIAYGDGQEDLILQVKYDGPVEEFGWLIPVPGLPTVKEGSMECFYELSKYTQKNFEQWPAEKTMSLHASKGIEEPEPPVKVIEIKTVGAYQVAVLSTKDVNALENWLTANEFVFPQDKGGVIDSYVKKGWYFVAAKINLSKTAGFEVISGAPKTGVSVKTRLEEKLSNGELHPLHLSFASEMCVFPLKISSVNGKPSEVQVYVLSPEPLLEKGMLEQKLPGIYSNDVVQAQKSADSFARSQLFRMRLMSESANGSISNEVERRVQKMRETPRVTGELPHYALVTEKDLPVCNRLMVSMTERSWWLTKETWTFQPDEMRDLEFQPAVPVFARLLDSRHGYYAAPCLAQLGSDAVRPLLVGLQSSNQAVRAAVMGAFEMGYADKIRGNVIFQEAAKQLIKNPDAEVRAFAVEFGEMSPEALLDVMHDEDFHVAGLAGQMLLPTRMYRPEVKKYIPPVVEMLKDKNPATRQAAIEALRGVQVKIPREDLLQFFTAPNLHVVATAYTKLEEEGEDVANEDAVPLLNNADPSVRMFGLKIIHANTNKSSVELALPLLKDSEMFVALRAAATLRALTGQQFTYEEADKWEKWWNDNSANFVVQLHPEELRPKLFGTNRVPASIDFRRP